jgi:hypothetical protein
MNASDDPRFHGDKVTALEIKSATADVACKKQSNLVAVWAAVEAAYQRRAIEKNAVQLNLIQRRLGDSLANANRILDGG